MRRLAQTTVGKAGLSMSCLALNVLHHGMPRPAAKEGRCMLAGFP